MDKRLLTKQVRGAVLREGLWMLAGADETAWGLFLGCQTVSGTVV